MEANLCTHKEGECEKESADVFFFQFPCKDIKEKLPDEFKKRKVVIVSLIGKSGYGESSKLRIINDLINREDIIHIKSDTTFDESDIWSYVQGYFDPLKNVVYLHTVGPFDTKMCVKYISKLTATETDEEFLKTWADLKYIYARSLLFLFSISHIILVTHPTFTFDLGYIQIIHALDNIRLKLLDKIHNLLYPIRGMTELWLENCRFCSPRMLFYFEDCPSHLKNTNNLKEIKEFEYKLEDQIYIILRKSRVVTKVACNCLLAIPANEEFVFVETNRDGLVKDYASYLCDCVKACVDKSAHEREDLWMNDHEYSVEDRKVHRMSKHSVYDFVHRHINTAFASGFEDNLIHTLRGPHRNIFQLPQLLVWFDAASNLYEFFARDEKVPEDFIELRYLLDSDTNFSNARHQKILQMALTAYADTMPAAYSLEHHQAKMEEVINIYAEYVRGPASEYFEKKFREACDKYYRVGRQKCGARSLRGNSCVLSIHRTASGAMSPTLMGKHLEVGALEKEEISISSHSSGIRVNSACNCGKKQTSRDDPFTIREANYEFYVMIGEKCVCSAYEKADFPIFNFASQVEGAVPTPAKVAREKIKQAEKETRSKRIRNKFSRPLYLDDNDDGLQNIMSTSFCTTGANKLSDVTCADETESYCSLSKIEWESDCDDNQDFEMNEWSSTVRNDQRVMMGEVLNIEGNSILNVNEDSPLFFEAEGSSNVDGENTINIKEKNLCNIEGQNIFYIEGERTSNIEGESTLNIEEKNLCNIEGQRIFQSEKEGISNIEGENTLNIKEKNLCNIEVQRIFQSEGEGTSNIDGENTLNIEGKNLCNIEGQRIFQSEGEGTSNIEGENTLNIKEKNPCNIEGRKISYIEGERSSNIEGQRTLNIEEKNLCTIEGQKVSYIEGERTSNIEEKNASNIEGINSFNMEGQERLNIKGERTTNIEGEKMENIKREGTLNVEEVTTLSTKKISTSNIESANNTSKIEEVNNMINIKGKTLEDDVISLSDIGEIVDVFVAEKYSIFHSHQKNTLSKGNESFEKFGADVNFSKKYKNPDLQSVSNIEEDKAKMDINCSKLFSEKNEGDRRVGNLKSSNSLAADQDKIVTEIENLKFSPIRVVKFSDSYENLGTFEIGNFTPLCNEEDEKNINDLANQYALSSITCKSDSEHHNTCPCYGLNFKKTVTLACYFDIFCNCKFPKCKISTTNDIFNCSIANFSDCIRETLLDNGMAHEENFSFVPAPYEGPNLTSMSSSDYTSISVSDQSESVLISQSIPGSDQYSVPISDSALISQSIPDSVQYSVPISDSAPLAPEKANNIFNENKMKYNSLGEYDNCAIGELHDYLREFRRDINSKLENYSLYSLTLRELQNLYGRVLDKKSILDFYNKLHDKKSKRDSFVSEKFFNIYEADLEDESIMNSTEINDFELHDEQDTDESEMDFSVLKGVCDIHEPKCFSVVKKVHDNHEGFSVLEEVHDIHEAKDALVLKAVDDIYEASSEPKMSKTNEILENESIKMSESNFTDTMHCTEKDNIQDSDFLSSKVLEVVNNITSCDVSLYETEIKEKLKNIGLTSADKFMSEMKNHITMGSSALETDMVDAVSDFTPCPNPDIVVKDLRSMLKRYGFEDIELVNESKEISEWARNKMGIFDENISNKENNEKVSEGDKESSINVTILERNKRAIEYIRKLKKNLARLADVKKSFRKNIQLSENVTKNYKMRFGCDLTCSRNMFKDQELIDLSEKYEKCSSYYEKGSIYVRFLNRMREISDKNDKITIHAKDTTEVGAITESPLDDERKFESVACENKRKTTKNKIKLTNPKTNQNNVENDWKGDGDNNQNTNSNFEKSEEIVKNKPEEKLKINEKKQKSKKQKVIKQNIAEELRSEITGKSRRRKKGSKSKNQATKQLDIEMTSELELETLEGPKKLQTNEEIANLTKPETNQRAKGSKKRRIEECKTSDSVANSVIDNIKSKDEKEGMNNQLSENAVSKTTREVSSLISMEYEKICASGIQIIRDSDSTVDFAKDTLDTSYNSLIQSETPAHSTTEYWPGMTHLKSPPNLLPLFSSWSMVCIGPANRYSHNLGLLDHTHAGFLRESAFLLPWNIYVRFKYHTVDELWPAKYPRVRSKEIKDFKTKLFVGIEYECPKGHRFICSEPHKALKAPEGGPVKECAKNINCNMPLYTSCPCSEGNRVLAQLMRVHVVTPKAPISVTVYPRVQPSEELDLIFVPSSRRPIVLTHSSYWILRLPYVYCKDDGTPIDIPEENSAFSGILFGDMFGMKEQKPEMDSPKATTAT